MSGTFTPVETAEPDILRIAIERGLATTQEIELARMMQERLARRDQYKDLLEVLVDQQVITRNQIERLRHEARQAQGHAEIPGYKLMAKLDEGSMGVVWKAKQQCLDRVVAIKILQGRLARNRELIRRFYAEAHLVACLTSSHIVSAIEIGLAFGQHYFVQEHVEGTSAQFRLDSGQTFPEPELLEIAIQAADALEQLRRRQVIHRDIKPQNLIITPEGTVKLVDFGLARFVLDKQLQKEEEGRAIGTPFYISPEQIRGDPAAAPPGDMYSLGAALYHMLTGRPPFPADTAAEALEGHLKRKAPPPHTIKSRVSEATSGLILRMLAKQPADRPEPQPLIRALRILLARAATQPVQPPAPGKSGIFRT